MLHQYQPRSKPSPTPNTSSRSSNHQSCNSSMQSNTPDHQAKPSPYTTCAEPPSSSGYSTSTPRQTHHQSTPTPTTEQTDRSGKNINRTRCCTSTSRVQAVTDAGRVVHVRQTINRATRRCSRTLLTTRRSRRRIRRNQRAPIIVGLLHVTTTDSSPVDPDTDNGADGTEAARTSAELDAAPVPTAFEAVTDTEYVVPFVKPSIVQLVDAVEHS